MPPSLHILIVDDEQVVLDTLGNYLRDSGHQVRCCSHPEAALELLEEETTFDIALIDIRLPRMDGLKLLDKMQAVDPELPVAIITGHGSMETVIQALRQGAADFLTKPVHLRDLDAVLARSARVKRLLQDNHRLRDTIDELQRHRWASRLGSIMIGESEATQQVSGLIRQAVEADCDTILITGETGTGKEVAARDYHLRRHTDRDPFIAVSCPAIPDSLVESELFGHVRGAFTGATASRAGCFELADGGTLFLDEIGDLSTLAQAKLLRVLESRQVRRVGSAREHPVNVNIVAATNSPLAERVESKSFRRDLYYRLNLFTIHIAPLRERPDDILPLAEHFLETFCKPRQKQIHGFTDEARARLLGYSYPGNVRELRNIVERAAILANEATIMPRHLHLQATPAPLTSAPQSSQLSSEEASEKTRIRQALETSKWNRSQAAKLLGMPYSSLRYKVKKYNLA